MTDPAPRRPRRVPHGYGLVLIALVAAVVVGAVGTRGLGLVLSALVLVGVWHATANAVGVSRVLRRAGSAVVVLLVVGAVVAFADGGSGVRAGVGFATAAVTVGVAVLIAADLLRHREVTLATVAGLVSLYLLIALIFGQLYLGCAELSSTAFASSVGPLGRFDLLYFSFVTITTVGFGDITPAIGVTRALAAGEAVTGQLFLVTVVARAVAMMRPPERRRTPPPGDG
ncbi:potassium channel family protein [Miltoncostaea oceani]|uniref:potassium channel family protein n=1 Tax=Miltoncostaea oceani TaxID=2843216 RepID=UPI001C3E4105|nr:potassium channel family protein [Miltoncostaea oceani]